MCIRDRYFQIGEWRRAGNVFNNALERVGENFRTARGLAEIALREGKICLLYTSDASGERYSVDLGGRRIIKKKKGSQPTHIYQNRRYTQQQ